MEVLNRDAHRGVLLEKTLFRRTIWTSHQRNRSPDDMRLHPFPYSGVERGEIALGDFAFGPINPVRMAKGDVAKDASRFLRWQRPASPSRHSGFGGDDGTSFNFACDLFRWLVFTQALIRCLPNPPAMSPAMEINFRDHFWLHPHRLAGTAFFVRDLFKRALFGTNAHQLAK